MKHFLEVDNEIILLFNSMALIHGRFTINILRPSRPGWGYVLVCFFESEGHMTFSETTRMQSCVFSRVPIL
jgi:hypothetical protein